MIEIRLGPGLVGGAAAMGLVAGTGQVAAALGLWGVNPAVYSSITAFFGALLGIGWRHIPRFVPGGRSGVGRLLRSARVQAVYVVLMLLGASLQPGFNRWVLLFAAFVVMGAIASEQISKLKAKERVKQ